jgi:acyl phosphate:glycerol-3-phosphate acyltransferase
MILMVLVPVLLVAAYLLGTFPTAVLVARRLGHDPTREGSGNPGASNVYRLAGRRAGLAVFAGDLVKGALAAGVGLAVGGRPLALACGAAAVLGHVAPVTRGFRGGRGVATGAGVAVVLYPLLAVPIAVLWALVVRVSGKASLASLVVVVAVPVTLVLIGRPAWELAGVAGIAALVALRHAGNIGRLLRGEERSIRSAGGTTKGRLS